MASLTTTAVYLLTISIGGLIEGKDASCNQCVNFKSQLGKNTVENKALFEHTFLSTTRFNNFQNCSLRVCRWLSMYVLQLSNSTVQRWIAVVWTQHCGYCNSSRFAERSSRVHLSWYCAGIQHRTSKNKAISMHFSSVSYRRGLNDQKVWRFAKMSKRDAITKNITEIAV